jgi:CheY-like chemotaxis protein
MANILESRRKVLFVDDDLDFLEVIRAAATATQHHWDILIADTTVKAVAMLIEHSINLAVIDVNLPVLDGSQFLTLLNHQYPSTIKVMLTGVTSESMRTECLGNGAELYLEKPRNQAEQEILFTMLNEVMAQRPDEGFRGVMQQVGLVDVIQMACLGGSSAVLEVKSARKRGEIFIRNGAIIHATAGNNSGQEALNRLLRLKRGEFRTRAFVEPPQESLSAHWEFLLMSGAQFRDEHMHLGEQDTMFLTYLDDPSRTLAETEAQIAEGAELSEATEYAETDASPGSLAPGGSAAGEGMERAGPTDKG